jgi:hypothetical protein
MHQLTWWTWWTPPTISRAIGSSQVVPTAQRLLVWLAHLSRRATSSPSHRRARELESELRTQGAPAGTGVQRGGRVVGTSEPLTERVPAFRGDEVEGRFQLTDYWDQRDWRKTE